MSQIKTRQRVKDLAEVYTNEREVIAMLDLVKEESESITSRFLEPSCGNGNFLIKILERKLETVKKRYSTQKQFEFNILKAISSIYGVDICPDNIEESRLKMRVQINNFYSLNLNSLFPNQEFLQSVNYILHKNILVGDMLNGTDEVFFSEFTYPKRSHFIEKIFSYQQVVEQDKKPIKEYEITHYMNLYKNKNK